MSVPSDGVGTQSGFFTCHPCVQNKRGQNKHGEESGNLVAIDKPRGQNKQGGEKAYSV